MKRSISLIDTDSSNSPRAHSVWQVWGQTRPVTAGTGLRKRRVRAAVVMSPSRMLAKYDGMSMLLGQPWAQPVRVSSTLAWPRMEWYRESPVRA